MPPLIRRFCLLMAVCLSPCVQAEHLYLVSDEWAPYTYRSEGQPVGIDVEIITQVLQRMGHSVEFEFLPWKRCLARIEQGQADGIVDIFQRESRHPYLIYPDAPMSEVEFVLFNAVDRPHPATRLEDLAGLRIGTAGGYTYGGGFDEADLLREAGPTHEANFGKLVRGRIDLLITDRRAGLYLAQALGIAEQVQASPWVISRQAQYLGFARKPGRARLAYDFADELHRFRREPAYAAILARYENAADRRSRAIEQQQGSTNR